MMAGREEVLDIFRKWRADGLFIRWQGNFRAFAFASRGYILSVDEHELRVRSRDSNSEVVMRFAGVLHFEYADSRTITGDEKRFQECIVAYFSEVSEEGVADSIAFAALEMAVV